MRRTAALLFLQTIVCAFPDVHISLYKTGIQQSEYNICIMDVKEAVNLAVKYVKDLFESQHITHLGLEEIEFDEASQSWLITVGFNRHWIRSNSDVVNMINSKYDEARRTYKVVKITNDKVTSLKNRPTQILA